MRLPIGTGSYLWRALNTVPTVVIYCYISTYLIFILCILVTVYVIFFNNFIHVYSGFNYWDSITKSKYKTFSTKLWSEFQWAIFWFRFQKFQVSFWFCQSWIWMGRNVCSQVQSASSCLVSASHLALLSSRAAPPNSHSCSFCDVLPNFLLPPI